MSVEERLARFLERRELSDGPWLVATSGGPDSMALLAGLERVAGRSHGLVAAHLDHRDHDRHRAAHAGLRRWCADRGIELLAASVLDPAALKEGREGYEAQARRVRRSFLRAAARTVGAREVYLAHHRDDQVETLLLNLGRGTGLFGLEGMRPVDRLGEDLRVLRPLLDVSRDELRRYAERRGVPFVDDPTNRSVERARNRLRHEVLPAWEAAQPDPRTAVDRLSRRAREENRFWEEYLEDRFSTWWWDTECQVGLADFRRAHPAAQRRLIHRILYRLLDETTGWSARNVNDTRDLFLSGSSGDRLSLPGGYRAIREYERGAVYRAGTPEGYRCRAAVSDGEVALPGVGRLGWRRGSSGPSSGNGGLVSRVRLDPSSPLVVRAWEPGDRPAGEEGPTLKERFHRERIPFRARRRWPLLVQDGRVRCVPALAVFADEAPGRTYRVNFRASAPCFHQYLEGRGSTDG